LHGARRPLVSKPGTSVTSATPATCRASLALSSQRAFKGPGGGEKATPRKRTLREASLLGRPHPPVVRAATSRLDIPRPRVFVRATSTPPRSIPRGRYRLGGACTASPRSPRRRRPREIADCLSFSRAKATSGGRTDAFVADPPSPRDVPNVSQTCHADATPRGLAESQRRVRAGLTRRREPTRRVSRGRRGARKGIRESDAWLIATRAPS
jgi:hypothetical protein